MFKDYPTPGYQYKVKPNDSPGNIEIRAYGSIKGVIESANPFLSSRRVVGGRPTIWTGDILNIPNLAPLRKITETLPGKDKNDFTLMIAGREIPVTSGRLLMTMDTGADGWTVTIPWTPGADPDLDENLLPFKYPEASVYLGGKLMNTGRVYGVNSSLTPTGRTKELAGFALTIDLVDSSVSPPYERNNITLEKLAADYISGLGIKAIFEADTGGKFDRLTASAEDKKFGHLAKVASERGLIVTNNEKGDLLFTVAKTSGQAVGTLEEGKPPVLSWGAGYDGRTLFNSYKANGESPGGDAQTATAIDDNVPGARNITFTADDTNQGDIGKAAEWQRSRRYADALEQSLPVQGWYAPNGELWKSNTLVTVISQTLDIPRGFTLLIQSVEFLFSTQGVSSVLKVIPPQVFTREPVPYVWGKA